MALPAKLPWIDPADPRAPSQEVWDRLSERERAQVIESLPSEFPVSESAPPEGDHHFEAKVNARQTLGRFFNQIGRKVYLACELPVYYPEEPMFAPDIMAVADVDPHKRMRWLVSAEKKGIDLAIEVHVAGSRRKDLERNVERYARLGIREYFLFDRGRLLLVGWRLGQQGTYEPIEPKGGFYSSQVLGLELRIHDEELRFYIGNAPLLGADALIDELRGMLQEIEQHRADEAHALQEEARRLRQELEQEAAARQQEAAARQQEAARREEAERKLAAALAELERRRQ